MTVACAARPPSERLILKRGPRGNLSHKTSAVLRSPPCAIGQGSPSCAHRSTKSPPRSGTNPGGELPVAPCLSQRGEAHGKPIPTRGIGGGTAIPMAPRFPWSILAAQAKPRRQWRELEASYQVGRKVCTGLGMAVAPLHRMHGTGAGRQFTGKATRLQRGGWLFLQEDW
jgi:hypothetical protein